MTNFLKLMKKARNQLEMWQFVLLSPLPHILQLWVSTLEQAEASGGSTTFGGGILCLEQDKVTWILMRQDDPRMCDKNKNCKNGLDEEENTVCQPAAATANTATTQGWKANKDNSKISVSKANTFLDSGILKIKGLCQPVYSITIIITNQDPLVLWYGLGLGSMVQGVCGLEVHVTSSSVTLSISRLCEFQTMDQKTMTLLWSWLLLWVALLVQSSPLP